VVVLRGPGQCQHQFPGGEGVHHRRIICPAALSPPRQAAGRFRY
jgi:hypothetical protein